MTLAFDTHKKLTIITTATKLFSIDIIFTSFPSEINATMETRMTFDPYGGRGQLMSDQRRKGDLDLAIALSLQDQYERDEVSVVRRSPVAPTNCKGIVDQHWELSDPNPNIHQLYVEFDSLFFWSKLTASGVAVDWSTRMTLYDYHLHVC